MSNRKQPTPLPKGAVKPPPPPAPPSKQGLEFSGSTRNICLSMNVLGAAAQAVTITLVGYEY